MLAIAGSIGESRLHAREKVFQYGAVKLTIEKSRRLALSEVERAAILKEIVDWNTWISSQRFMRTTQWSWWHPEEGANLEFLE